VLLPELVSRASLSFLPTAAKENTFGNNLAPAWSLSLSVSRVHAGFSLTRETVTFRNPPLDKEIYKPEHVVEIYKKEIIQIYKTEHFVKIYKRREI
jgi:hypothetical protein